MTQFLTRLFRYLGNNAIAVVALMVALGGTSYAAFSLPAGSVGTRQLQNSAVTPAKLSRGAIGGYVLAWAHVGINGHIWSGSRGAYADVPTDTPSPVSTLVGWHGVKLPNSCVPIVTPQNTNPNLGQQTNATLGVHQLSVWTYNAQGHYTHFPFYVAVICR